MATHSSSLVWRIPWTEEPGGLQSRGLQRAGMTERLNTHTHTYTHTHTHTHIHSYSTCRMLYGSQVAVMFHDPDHITHNHCRMAFQGTHGSFQICFEPGGSGGLCGHTPLELVTAVKACLTSHFSLRS